jgi:uncharacterized protein
MSIRFIFIHGNSTSHWSSSWGGWLKKEMDKLGLISFFETFPDSINARAEYWLPFLKDHVKVGSDDVIIGWSSGAVAALRYAEENKIKSSILISPSYTDLNDPLEKQSGFFDKPWRWENIKDNQQNIALFYGNDDPFIPQEQFEFIASKLKPEVIIINDGKHFIEYNTFPQLLDYIKIHFLE